MGIGGRRRNADAGGGREDGREEYTKYTEVAERERADGFRVKPGMTKIGAEGMETVKKIVHGLAARAALTVLVAAGLGVGISVCRRDDPPRARSGFFRTAADGTLHVRALIADELKAYRRSPR